MSNNKKIISIAIEYFNLNSVSFKFLYNVLKKIGKNIIRIIKDLINEYDGFCLYLHFNKILKENYVSFYVDKKHNKILNLIDGDSYNGCTIIQDVFQYLQGDNLNDLRLWYYGYSRDNELLELYDKERTLALLYHCQDRGHNFFRNLSIYLPNKKYININLRDIQGKNFKCIDRIYIFENYHYVIIGGYVLGVTGNNYVIRYYILDRKDEYKLLNEVYVKDVDKYSSNGFFESIKFNHFGLTLVYNDGCKYAIVFNDAPYYIFDHVFVYSNEYTVLKSTNEDILAISPSSEPVPEIKQYHSGVYPIRIMKKIGLNGINHNSNSFI